MNSGAEDAMRLATRVGRTHIEAMATRTEAASNKGSMYGASVLGRSAATGRLVLAPVSKPGAISLKQAKAAVASVRNGKK